MIKLMANASLPKKTGIHMKKKISTHSIKEWKPYRLQHIWKKDIIA